MCTTYILNSDWLSVQTLRRRYQIYFSAYMHGFDSFSIVGDVELINRSNIPYVSYLKRRGRPGATKKPRLPERCQNTG